MATEEAYLDRVLTMEVGRCTEAAAIAASKMIGRGDKEGADQAAKLAFEVEYLARWTPHLAGEDETRALVRAAIAELGADDPKLAGRVTGHIMKTGTGLDGGLVSRLVREELGA